MPRSFLVGLLFLLGHALAAPAQQAGALPAAVGEDARIHPGDRIALRIWNEPAMSDTFSVAETGEAVLPKLGPVRVVEIPAALLRDSLRTAYAEFLRNPDVEITVLRRIGVIGEVREPNLYLVDLTMTLRDILARAGGITAQGDPGKIEIVRGGERIRLVRGEEARFMATALHSGDQVVVGRRNWFELNSLAIASTAAVIVSVLSAFF